MNGREFTIQENVLSFLEKHSIYPFSVICTFVLLNGVVSITFFLREDLDNFLELIGYKSLCDNSGFIILKDNNTILLTDKALLNFYINLL